MPPTDETRAAALRAELVARYREGYGEISVLVRDLCDEIERLRDKLEGRPDDPFYRNDLRPSQIGGNRVE